MEGIQVSVNKTGIDENVSVIKVGGYIDTTTSAEVERALDSVLREGSYNIVIDLGNVDYISSAGWGIFISEIKGIREKGGDLKLVNMMPDVYEVFELLEFHYILKAFDSQEDAITDFGNNSIRGSSEISGESSMSSSEDVEPSKSKQDLSDKTSATPGSTQSTQTVEDKIRQIILQKPDASISEIKKLLNTESYNYTKIGLVDIWKRLKNIGLSSKKKRIQFFKKHAFS